MLCIRNTGLKRAHTLEWTTLARFIGRTTVKRCGVMFSSYAVHLANSLDTDSSIYAIRRFLSSSWKRRNNKVRQNIYKWNQSKIGRVCYTNSKIGPGQQIITYLRENEITLSSPR